MFNLLLIAKFLNLQNNLLRVFALFIPRADNWFAHQGITPKLSSLGVAVMQANLLALGRSRNQLLKQREVAVLQMKALR